MDESLGERVRRLRMERGLSQRDLAVGGITISYLSRIEAARREPSFEPFRNIAGSLGVTPLYLETGQDDYCPHCGRGR